VIKDGGKLISELAPVASPVFTGDPQAPTPATADSDTSIATTTFVKAQGYATSASVPVPATVAPPMDGATAVGAGTKYAREDHVHPSDTSRAALNQVVRYDAVQTLTAPQLVQARSNIYAAPFDALAYSGMQINGSCDVSQERGNVQVVVIVGASTYIQDGWRLFYTSAPLAITAYPLTANRPLAGFVNAIFIQATTGKASLAIRVRARRLR
jgi:hypothetical protein